MRLMNSCFIAKTIWNKKNYYCSFNEDERPFEISRDDDVSWVLSGEKLEKLFVMTNMERDESIMKFARQLRGMGVDEALRERGAKDGDIVRISNFRFGLLIDVERLSKC